MMNQQERQVHPSIHQLSVLGRSRRAPRDSTTLFMLGSIALLLVVGSLPEGLPARSTFWHRCWH